MSTEQTGGPSRAAAPRTLADDLRSRDDGALAALFRARPDLLSPVPNDLTQLATRAGTRASVLRAVERLDRFALQVAQALAVAPEPAGRDGIAALLTGERGRHPEDAADEPGREAVEAAVAAELPRALGTLRTRALVWGGDDRLRLVRTARELLAPGPSSPSPTGLGPTLAEATSGSSPGTMQDHLTAVGLPPTHDPVSALESLTALFTDHDRMAALLAGAPAGARPMLTKLMWGPPYGTVDTASPSPPAAWLLRRALLVPAGAGTVVLPREVALHLRAGRAHRRVEPLPPQLTARRTVPGRTADTAAAGQAFTAVTTVEELLTLWGQEPPPVLRSGGLGVRELKRTASALDLPEPTAAFWIELAWSAGLLAADGEADEVYAPTPAADDWLQLPAAERWVRLATAWLDGTRVAGLAGGRDAKGRSLSVLGTGLDRPLAPAVRRRTLTLLSGLEPGGVPERAGVLERLRWERPLRGTLGPHGEEDGHPPLRDRLAEWALDEAELLGLTGRGALPGFVRPLLPDGSGDGQPDGAGEALPDEGPAPRRAAGELTPLLPEPLNAVLLQADLTAVAPGPLERPLAETLSSLADIESKGGATVYRFTPESVRRGLDAGRSAADIHAFLRDHSQTPVPQPLAYLVDDVARRHGALRVGAASSYVRCDDETVPSQILADRRADPLRLRRLAPTVLAAPVPPDQLLEKLREMGYAPAAESATGDVVVSRTKTHRTPARAAPEPVPDGPPLPEPPLVEGAVRALRAGDLAAASAPRTESAASGAATGREGGLPRTTSAETLATMQAAALTGGLVWMGFVDAAGSASQHVIAPLRVEGGFVTGYDETADAVRTYPLHRITGAAELPPE